jgi:hypothetical protein
MITHTHVFWGSYNQILNKKKIKYCKITEVGRQGVVGGQFWGSESYWVQLPPSPSLTQQLETKGRIYFMKLTLSHLAFF